MIKFKSLIFIWMITLVMSIKYQLYAQDNPMSSMYYQNQYLGNPSMAGFGDNLKLNIALRKLYSGMPGAPVNQTFTADGRLNERVGLGINLNNEKAGLLQYTRVMGSYAYHLPVGSNSEKLRFGVSLGFMNERINDAELFGDLGDESVMQINKNETFIDGDFGFAYTSDRLTIQGALPNLKRVFRADDNNVVNYSTFFSSISYKFYLSPNASNEIVLEPKLIYKGVKGYNNSVDIGLNAYVLEHGLSILGIYHSTKSATFGLGLDLNKTFNLMGVYTAETGRLSGYSNGNLEIGLKVNLF